MNINLTLIGQAIAFALFVAFCMKYIWPPVVAALRERQQKIDDGLVAADRAQRELLQAKEECQQLLQQAREQAQNVLADANKKSNEIIANTHQQARGEKEKIVNSAQEEISRSVDQLKAELRLQLSELVVDAVKQIVRDEVKIGTHQKMLQELGKKL